jgi:hypothetical protein
MADNQATSATPDPTTTTNPSGSNHAYDNVTLDSLQFLAAVMHAPEADINDRIAAAAALLPYYQPPLKPTVRPWYVNGVPGNEDCIVVIKVPALN